MCLAVGFIRNNQRSKLGELWWKIASVPYKLFLFLGLFHIAVLAGLSISQTLTVRHELLIFIVSIAIVGPFILSLLMTFLPEWYRSSEIDYEKYGISYYLLFISLVLMELGLITNDLVFLSGAILLVFSWLLTIKIILSNYKWSVRVSFSRASKYGLVLKSLLAFVPINIMLLFSGYDFSLIINLISILTVLMLSIMTALLFNGRQLSH